MHWNKSILEYKNYNAFLLDYHSFKSQQSSNWSMGVWARLLRLAGTSSLSMILKGDRDPGPKVIQAFEQYFKFSQEEKVYFKILIKVGKITKDPMLKNVIKEEFL